LLIRSPSTRPILYERATAREATCGKHAGPPLGAGTSARAGGKESVTVTFQSILFEHPEQRAPADRREAPAFFADLHLDQVIASITATREEYDLIPFFSAALHDVEAITYRHGILRDLEGKALWGCIGLFARQMRAMRAHLAQADKLHHAYQQERWFLDAVGLYGEAVDGLQRGLAGPDINSRGFLALRAYLARYVQSPDYTALLAEAAQLQTDLAGITYCLHIQGGRVTVSKYDAEVDYAAEVAATFRKFAEADARDYRTKFPDWPEMNHVEAGILERVARLYPDVFQALGSFCERHRRYLDRTIADFDREVQFYVAYLEYVRGFAASGLPFCYPQVSDRAKEVAARDTFDLALANTLIPQGAPVVCNDLALAGRERIIVVTGPNQGGKTTFARTFGQLHYLASLGCPVPGREARLFLYDHLFTHFEQEEQLHNLRGKLQDDLVRIHDILSLATPRSIVILNEIFSSTTFDDALLLSEKVLERIVQLDLLCVCVTFIDELASLGESIVSMVSTVDPADPATRTYKVVRRPAAGRAYAAAIAEKYGLSYERLKERIAR
jgi:hypothetical protein